MISESLKANLLIVEDDSFIRKLYKEILKDIDKINLSELETAENAIEYIKQSKPDIVIMDYRLPGMNGLEATKQIIMAHPPDTIVLVVSGDERSSLEEEMLEVGAISFLKKPVRGKLLYFTIMNFVEIILAKKRLKLQIDKTTIKHAESTAAQSYACKPPKPLQVTKESSDTFVSSFENKGIDDSAETMLTANNEAKDAMTFLSQLGEDIEYVEDFIDSYDSLKYAIEKLDVVVEADILKEISILIKKQQQ